MADIYSPSLLWAVLGIVIYYVALQPLYRVTLHPLAGFPGPKLAAATKWYEFYFDFLVPPGGQFAAHITRLHRKYGPVIRINPDELHVDDPEYSSVLYAPGSRRHKGKLAANMTGIPKSTFGTSDYDIHKARRNPNMLMFARRAIYGPVQDVLIEEGEELSKQLRILKNNGSVTDIRSYFLAFSSVFACRYLIGIRPDYLENPKSLKWLYGVVKSIPPETPVVKQFPLLVKVGPWLPRSIQAWISPPLVGITDLQYESRRRATYFMKNFARVETEASKIHTPQTIFHAIIQSNLPDDEKSYDRLWQEAFNVFFAAVDTTSRTMTWSTYYLLTHPGWLSKVRRELEEAWVDPLEPPPYEKLDGLPFLTATIKETIRHSQLISGRIPVFADEDLFYGTWRMPAGTPISMTISDMMMNEGIYPEAKEWKPERWLDGDVLHTRLDPYWTPFGRGPRMCQGPDLAWAMMYRALATVHRRFVLEPVDLNPERDMKIVAEHFFGDPSPQSKFLRTKIVSERR